MLESDETYDGLCFLINYFDVEGYKSIEKSGPIQELQPVTFAAKQDSSSGSVETTVSFILSANNSIGILEIQ